jgi:hypothetical protein
MEVSGQLHAPAALSPEKEPLVPIGEEAGWASEPFWTQWRREKFPALAGNRTLEPRSPVLKPTELSRLLPLTCKCNNCWRWRILTVPSCSLSYSPYQNDDREKPNKVLTSPLPLLWNYGSRLSSWLTLLSFVTLYLRGTQRFGVAAWMLVFQDLRMMFPSQSVCLSTF